SAIAPFPLIQWEEEGRCAVAQLARQRLFGPWPCMQRPPALVAAVGRLEQQVVGEDKWFQGQQRHQDSFVRVTDLGEGWRDIQRNTVRRGAGPCGALSRSRAPRHLHL